MQINKKSFSTIVRSGVPPERHYYIAGLLKVSIILITILSSCAPSDTNDSRTLILAHAMHPTHPVSIAMERMAENVAVLSNGELQIKIYPAGQLGGERTLLELIQIGTIDITKVTTARLENIVPSMRVYSLPYLFRDREHVINVLDGDVGQELLLQGKDYNLLGIAYYDAGSRSFYTKDRPVHSPSDLRGLKIRVIESVIAMQLMRRLNGAPTPIPWGELYTAFQGGIVDGAENNPPSFFTSRHYEVCRYYSLNEHTTIPDILVMGTRVWNNLSDQQRSWLREALDESVEFQRELWQEFTLESLQRVQEAGVEIIYPDKEPFRQMLDPMYKSIEQNDPDLHYWVERIRNIE